MLKKRSSFVFQISVNDKIDCDNTYDVSRPRKDNKVPSNNENRGKESLIQPQRSSASPTSSALKRGNPFSINENATKPKLVNSRKREKEKHWLTAYQERSSVPLNEVMGHSMGLEETSKQIDPIDEKGYLINKGSARVDDSIMIKQIKNGNITIFNINKNNAKYQVERIISEHNCHYKNEYIFALSESGGLRILRRLRLNVPGFNEEAFHHQNIFRREDIISTGTIYIDKGRLIITNASGHFKPSLESLTPIAQFLSDSGVSQKHYIMSDYLKVNEHVM